MSTILEVGKKFEFSEENLIKAREIISAYPQGREKSAVMALLDLAQRQNANHISTNIIEYIAKLLNLPEMKVYEIASFYSMYNLKPVGKYLIQICGTTPCMLRGSTEIIKFCEKKLGIGLNQTTPDQLFTIKEVECLGACVNAPLVQINDDYYEDLTTPIMEQIINNLIAGKAVKTGSQANRQCSAPTANFSPSKCQQDPTQT